MFETPLYVCTDDAFPRLGLKLDGHASLSLNHLDLFQLFVLCRRTSARPGSAFRQFFHQLVLRFRRNAGINVQPVFLLSDFVIHIKYLDESYDDPGIGICPAFKS